MRILVGVVVVIVRWVLEMCDGDEKRFLGVLRGKLRGW